MARSPKKNLEMKSFILTLKKLSIRAIQTDQSNKSSYYFLIENKMPTNSIKIKVKELDIWKI